MDLVATKILVAILLGVLRFIFGIIPIKVYYFLCHWGEDCDPTIHAKRHKQVLCFIARLQSFGGGVLFATCFLHMIPEVRKSTEELKKFWNIDEDTASYFPYSELVISVGFFLIYFIEDFAHWIVNGRKTTPLITPNESIKIVSFDEDNNKGSAINVTTVDSAKQLERLHQSNEYLNNNKNGVVLTIGSGKQVQNGYVQISRQNSDAGSIKQQRQLRGLLVIIALAFHSLFEGLSIGLLQNKGNIWFMFTSMSIHAATILYIVSFEMAIAKVRTGVIVAHMVVLALVSPLGIIIGLIITINSDINTEGKSHAIVLLEGLSAGTVLYITFFEVLNREKHRRRYRFSRGVCIMAGFLSMLLLKTFEN